MKQIVIGRTVLAGSLALALSACGGGGGGGNVRIDPPPTTPPPTTPPPTTPPPTTPPPTTPPPTSTQPAIDAHLSIINAYDRGNVTGKGVRIGVVDSGVNRRNPTLSGRVVSSRAYVDPRANNLNVDDVVGHGTTVASLAAGRAFGNYPGGVAPDALIVSARIIADTRPDDDGSGDGNEVDGALGLAGVHQDLITDGVKIMNNSWGGLYWTNAAATAPIAAEYRPFIVGNNGLVVFATGNESRANPSDMAALPSQRGPGNTLPAADLERGWLAVTAVDSNDPAKLASYANACGVAANYCLAAPGSAVFLDPQNTGGTPSYYWGSGTSYAAPLVSGAAALVWERFPSLSNDQVRQILLGTASDLGAPGVDAVFGHGLLNVGRALRGPGRLDWGDLHVMLPSDQATSWWGGLSGAGGIVADGGGNVVDGVADPSLSLSGQNRNAGQLRVTGGATVSVNDLYESDIVVDTGSYLYAWEVTVNGDITNNGVMQINSAKFVNRETDLNGTLRNNGILFNRDFAHTTLNGDFTQSAGGEFWMLLGTDPLHITGKAALDGELFVYGVAEGYVPRRVHEVLQADGGVEGRFSAWGYNAATLPLLQATVHYDPNRVYLDVEPTSVTVAAGAGASVATLASASRVEAAFQALDARLQPTTASTAIVLDPVVTAAAGAIQRTATNEALAASLDSLSGKAHGLAAAMTFDTIDMNRRALSSRFDAVMAAPRLQGAWHNTLGEAGQGSFAGSGVQTQGWMMGQDMAVGSNAVAGFAFGETRSTSSAAWGDERGRDRQSQAQVYAGWNSGHGYALGQFGVGQFTRQIDRQLLLGAGQYGVDARYGGHFSAASVESGYRFGTARAALTPYLGAEYARVESDGFSEQGGFGFGLRAAGSQATRSQALAGLRAERQWGGWSLRGYAEWQQMLSSSGLDVQASFVGVDAWAPMAGLQPARSGGLFGVSVESWLSRNSRVAFGYDQRFGPRGDLHQVALRYMAAF